MPGWSAAAPGYQETLRVNGRAAISTDPDHLGRTAFKGKPPKSVIVVAVEHLVDAVATVGDHALAAFGAGDAERGGESGIDFPQLDRPGPVGGRRDRSG